MKFLRASLGLSLLAGSSLGFSQNSMHTRRPSARTVLQQTNGDASDIDNSNNNNNNSEETRALTRRGFVGATTTAVGMAATTGLWAPPMANAAGTSTSTSIAKSSDGNLPDLPSEAVRSYLQYRIPLQIAADYYVFNLQDMVTDIDQWGEVGQLFRVNNNRGQGQPSKIERDYVNPMRILLLSFPPDISEEMRDAQFRFERAANTISKATAGYRRDLPVEVDAKSITNARVGWDEGRVALNDFFVLLNTAVGLDELTPIPAPGPNQVKEYGRSARRYNELQKKIKLCQNRGGPALSQAWGQLMVSGYLQDSCGIPDMDEYFRQK